MIKNLTLYKKKIFILSSMIFFLLLIYLLSFIIDPNRQNTVSFAFLSPSLVDHISSMEIYGLESNIILNRRNNVWYFLRDEGDHFQELPVKQFRVLDLLDVLTGTYRHTLRANSFDARFSLGVSDGNSSRIIIRGGAGLPLLDLHIGTVDALGRELFTRMAGRNEIYSSEDRLSIFIDSSPAFWYDLRLFPEISPNVQLEGFGSAGLSFIGAGSGQVQQAEVIPFGSPESYALFRMGNNWLMSGESGELPDSQRVESWLRSLLDAEAMDFTYISSNAVQADAGGGIIYLWMGDGSMISLEIVSEENGSYNVSVSTNSLIYVLPQWAMERIFRERDFFLGE